MFIMRKKVTLFLLLLLTGGAVGLRAQTIELGNEVTSLDDGLEIALQNAASGNFLGGTTGNLPIGSTQIDENCIFVVEAGSDVEVESLEGETMTVPTAYLKHKTTGQYIKAINRRTDAEADYGATPVGIYYTSDVSEAMPFVWDETAAPTFLESSGSQSGSLIIGTNCFATDRLPSELGDAAAAEVPTGNRLYLCGYASSTMYFADYQDSNTWSVYEATEGGSDLLINAALAKLPDEITSETVPYYETTPLPGHTTKAAYQQLYDAHQAALDFAAQGGTTAECEKAIADLEAATKAVEDATVKTIDAGYYILKNKNGRAIFDDGTTAYIQHADAPEDIQQQPKYFWQVVTGDDGKLYFKNLMTARYIGAAKSGGLSSEITPTLNAEQAYTYTYQRDLVETSTYFGSFLLEAATGNSSTYGLHSQADGRLVWWNDRTAGGNNWTFTPVTADNLDEIIAEAEKKANMEALSEAYKSAQAIWGSSHVYDSDATKDNTYTDGLITSADELASNADHNTITGTADGQGLPGLVDKDVSTYFHSLYTDPNSVGAYHNIQVNLNGTTAQNFVVKLSKRQTHKTVNYPTLMAVYASQDGQTWKFQDYISVDYNCGTDDSGVTDNSSFISSAVKLDAAYSHLRFDIIKTEGGDSYQYPFFALAEMQLYPCGTDYDKNLSSAVYVDAAIASRLETAMATARQQLADSAATKDATTELQEATEAYTAACPDPLILTQAVKTARTVLESAIPGSTVGCVSEDGYATFENVIAEVEGNITEVMSKQTIDDNVKKLEDATAAFYHSLIIPSEGLYTLQSKTTGTQTGNGAEGYVISTSNENGAQTKWSREVENADVAKTLENSPEVMWLLTHDGDSIRLQNVATGYYMGKTSSLNGRVTTVKTPTNLSLKPTNMGDQGIFNIAVGSGLMLNAQATGTESESGSLVAWSSGTGTDNSAFTFNECPEPNFFLRQMGNDVQFVCLPYAIVIPNYGEMYTVAGQNGDALDLEKAKGVTAGQPFLYVPLEGGSDTGYEEFEIELGDHNLPIVVNEPQAEDANNGLIGTFSSTSVPAGIGYLNKKGEIAITTGNTTIGTNSAYIGYLNETTAQGDKTLQLLGQVTGIDNVTIPTGKVEIYDLSGRRITHPGKGIYIINGQKVIIK